MPFFMAPSAHAALTANGDLEGFITVADATPFYPGARVWLRSSGVASKEYMITDIATGNKIGLRLVRKVAGSESDERTGGQSYGRTPVTEYTTAQTATISQEKQVVPVELHTAVKLNLV